MKLQSIIFKICLIVPVFVIVTSIIISCDSSIHTDKLAFFDIVDAEHLMIADGNQRSAGLSTASSSSPTRLFKITDQGFLVEVSFRNEQGNRITRQISPIRIESINGEWLVVVFGLDEMNPEEAFLVRKTDGAAFEIPKNRLPFPDHYGRYITFSNGEAYFVTRSNTAAGHLSGALGKMTLTEQPTIEIITPSTDTIAETHGVQFAVDSSGNLIYKALFMDNVNTIVRRVRYNFGEFDLFIPKTDFFWTGLDGNIYFTDIKDNCTDNCFQFKQVIFDGSSHSFTDYGLIPNDIVNSNWMAHSLVKHGPGGIDTIVRVSTETRIIFFEPQIILEVFNSVSNGPRVLVGSDSLNLTSIESYAVYEDTVFIAGRNESGGVLLAVDTTSENYNHNNVLPAGFEVFKIGASSSDELLIHALRLRDGRRILGRLNTATRSVVIIDEDSDMTVTNLLRVR